MAGENTYHDQDHIAVLAAVSSADGKTIVLPWADPNSHAILTTTTGGGGTGTWYAVSGTIDGANKTFTIPVVPTSDFVLVLVNQTQMQGIDYTYVGNTITTTSAPDASLSGLGFMAFVIS